MFQMMALVCGLTMQEGMDDEGCYLYTHPKQFESKEVCEKTLIVSGLPSLGMFLAQKGELEATLEGYSCQVPDTEVKG